MADKFSDIIQSDTPTLVDFFADWCGPCKMMKPILQDVKSQVGDQVRIIKVDVEKNRAVADAFQIEGIPTLILFQGGQVKWRQSGVVPTSKLVSVVQSFVPKA